MFAHSELTKVNKIDCLIADVSECLHAPLCVWHLSVEGVVLELLWPCIDV